MWPRKGDPKKITVWFIMFVKEWKSFCCPELRNVGEQIVKLHHRPECDIDLDNGDCRTTRIRSGWDSCQDMQFIFFSFLVRAHSDRGRLELLMARTLHIG